MSDEKLLNYFIDDTRKRFDRLECKVDALNGFKWKVTGAVIVTGSILQLIFMVFFKV